MKAEQQFNFLRVRNKLPYFARVSVVTDTTIQGIQISPEASSHDPHFNQEWLEAACIGASKAYDKHAEIGGDPFGLLVTRVFGTEVDTTVDSVETAACFAAWKALGHQESELLLDFDGRWRISFDL